MPKIVRISLILKFWIYIFSGNNKKYGFLPDLDDLLDLYDFDLNFDLDQYIALTYDLHFT